MTELAQQQCEACRVGAPQVNEEEMAELIREIPDWVPITRDGVLMLQREFPFANWVDALAFTNKVGELAEKFGHHPEVITEWGKATVTWWTHKIRGLHKTDFIMAAKTDKLV